MIQDRADDLPPSPPDSAGGEGGQKPFLAIAALLLAASVRAAAPSPEALAARIDARITAGLGSVVAAEPASDAEFYRRIHLDLAGRIPTAADVRTFLADRAPDKRARAVSRLLAGPGYIRHAARLWRARWLPQGDQPQFASLVPGFEQWLRDSVRDNRPYDALVRELLADRDTGTPASPRAFALSNDPKPEGRAGVSARLLLGLNLDCAQCHDHPFARWTQDQFWQYAANFTAPGSDGQLSLAVTGTPRTVTARYLDDTRPTLTTKTADAGRLALSAWVTTGNNPYFARNAVNRVWADLFGVGLVEPLDDLSGATQSSHPELMDELTAAFVASGFDLKYLVNALALSATYARSSVAPPGAMPDEEARLFRRASVRALTADQLYDSLLLATGLPESPDDPAAGYRRSGDPRLEFLARFGRPERPGEAQRSILQALTLMNGATVAQATDPRQSRTLAAVVDAPWLDAPAKVDALYLAALGRLPASDERMRATAYGANRDRRQALADLFWVLLNGAEFGTNH